MNVRLHIDRLVLEGIEIPNRNALQIAVQTELARLIGERGVAEATRIGNVPRVSAPAITVDCTKPERLGNGIAGALYTAIGRWS